MSDCDLLLSASAWIEFSWSIRRISSLLKHLQRIETSMTKILLLDGVGQADFGRRECSAPPESYIQDLISAAIVVQEDWERLSRSIRDNVLACSELDQLLPMLTQHRLITPYQARRIESGTVSGLVMGNYRILDRLGAGGMSVVFKAEQLALRREVAIKVLVSSSLEEPKIISRFRSEIRAVAKLQHPNIVTAIDAGVFSNDDPQSVPTHYFVMEYVPGQDLEEYVRERGALPVDHACDLIQQIASALDEANAHQLVHRDIKPSNIRVTPEGQAKLVDFGLARQWESRQTQTGTVLGTIDFMAPEQARDAAAVDIRADVYALGGTLFWCITGHVPFPAVGKPIAELIRRMNQAPPSARAIRGDLPAELDTVLARMMANNPNDRYQNPRAVISALLPFLKRASARRESETGAVELFPIERPVDISQKILVVDDNPQIRNFCRLALESPDASCDEASDGPAALAAIDEHRPDIVLLDVDLPTMSGHEVLKRIRANPLHPFLKVIMFSGRASPDEMAQAMFNGADDYLTKPFSVNQLQAHVQAALKLKVAQERADDLQRSVITVRHELEVALESRDRERATARETMAAVFERMARLRSLESANHMTRMRQYARRLGEEAATASHFRGTIDAAFVELLECCIPAHDIGMLGLPDHILLKPGKLSDEERVLMQTHTILGAEIIQSVANQNEMASGFFKMLIDIMRHHHENYDGHGYPDGLAGDSIPLAARIAKIIDVYDALRSPRSYKPRLSHPVALRVMSPQSARLFDPNLLELFVRTSHDFDRIYQSLPD